MPSKVHWKQRTQSTDSPWRDDTNLETVFPSIHSRSLEYLTVSKPHLLPMKELSVLYIVASQADLTDPPSQGTNRIHSRSSTAVKWLFLSSQHMQIHGGEQVESNLDLVNMHALNGSCNYITISWSWKVSDFQIQIFWWYASNLRSTSWYHWLVNI